MTEIPVSLFAIVYSDLIKHISGMHRLLERKRKCRWKKSTSRCLFVWSGFVCWSVCIWSALKVTVSIRKVTCSFWLRAPSLWPSCRQMEGETPGERGICPVASTAHAGGSWALQAAYPSRGGGEGAPWVTHAKLTTIERWLHCLLPHPLSHCSACQLPHTPSFGPDWQNSHCPITCYETVDVFVRF